ncbi:MAG: SDR family oxidoreductase [Candidatus Komeilibacteria bacterium]
MLNLKQLTDLSGKTAIVTGGAVGIGFGISYRLAEAGANVVIADLNRTNTYRAARELKAKRFHVLPVLADVSKRRDVNTMVSSAVKTFGSVDILVNNAGIYPMYPLLDLTDEVFNQVLAVNLKGVFICTQAVARQMIKQKTGGKIINITSIDALHPSMPNLSAYDASKHGVWGFTKSAALGLAPHKIWVNAIAPGGIATPGSGVNPKTGKYNSKKQEETMKAFSANIPMGRIGQPDDIGKVALFLASDMASYMTGEQIVVDGGVLLK